MTAMENYLEELQENGDARLDGRSVSAVLREKFLPTEPTIEEI